MVCMSPRCAVRLERGRATLSRQARAETGPPPWLSGADHGRCRHRRAGRKPGAQAGRAQGRHGAAHGHGPGHAAVLRRRGRTRHARAVGRSGTAGASAARAVGQVDAAMPTCRAAQAATGVARGQVAGHGRAVRRSSGGPAQILDIWPGFHAAPLCGLAIDLGSTTIAAHLCDLADGTVIAAFGDHEPADTLRRRPDEPGELRDAEPRRCRRDDSHGARSARHPDRRAGRRGRGTTPPDHGSGDRVQPGHASPAAGRRSGRAGPGPVRAGHVGCGLRCLPGRWR